MAFDDVRTDPDQAIYLAVGEDAMTRSFEFGPAGSNDMGANESFTGADSPPTITPSGELTATAAPSGTKIVVTFDATTAVAGTLYKVVVQGTTNNNQRPKQGGLVRVGNA